MQLSYDYNYAVLSIESDIPTEYLLNLTHFPQGKQKKEKKVKSIWEKKVHQRERLKLFCTSMLCEPHLDPRTVAPPPTFPPVAMETAAKAETGVSVSVV